MRALYVCGWRMLEKRGRGGQNDRKGVGRGASCEGIGDARGACKARPLFLGQV